MSQQISVDDALEAFRKRHSDLADENVLLRAQVTGLERRLADAEKQAADARAEAERLRAQPPTGQAPQPLSCMEPDALP